MIKGTVFYGHPKDVDAFEKYYAETHLPLVSKTSGVVKAEYTKFLPNPDGTAPAYYRMAELYFDGLAELQQALNSPEGKAMAADLSNFATGGVTIIFGTVE
ncbi:MAG: EthD family reductase [Bacteroidetes bacterium]|nr:EthD family reductase [Bacteroidota bacterium]MBS1931092.1 EthD family reductase [Bacteroidota bacterium]